MSLVSDVIRTEMRTVEAMIGITCRGHHRSKSLCPDCAQLREYAHLRLIHCRFGGNKPTCIKCPSHCYKPNMKERIRLVMRYAGPRMLLHHPWLTLIHVWKERQKKGAILTENSPPSNQIPTVGRDLPT